MISCVDCKSVFALNRSVRKIRCEPCQLEHVRAKARAISQNKCRERGAVKIGVESACTHCGIRFVRTGARNYLCPPCGARSTQRALTDEQRKKARSYKRAWDGNNRPKLQVYQKESRVRRKVNPAFAINERMSAGVRFSLERGKQGSSWESLVGYTLADLMIHLERQFRPGMTWANRGEWHIDHVRPLCGFKFQAPECPQFREAWALTNLRPLWAADNLSKSGRRVLLL